MKPDVVVSAFGRHSGDGGTDSCLQAECGVYQRCTLWYRCFLADRVIRCRTPHASDRACGVQSLKYRDRVQTGSNLKLSKFIRDAQ